MKRKHPPNRVIEMPAGLYIIGDPCYSLSHDDCDAFYDAGGDVIQHSFGDHVACAFRTAFGDGGYDDNKGRKYGVDSGTIGLVPLALLKIDRPGAQWTHPVRFTKPTRCSRSATGTLRFGSITIRTGDL